jgi:hypothetical protein
VTLMHERGKHLSATPAQSAEVDLQWHKVVQWRSAYERYLAWEQQANAASANRGKPVKLIDDRSLLGKLEAAQKVCVEAADAASAGAAS